MIKTYFGIVYVMSVITQDRYLYRYGCLPICARCKELLARDPKLKLDQRIQLGQEYYSRQGDHSQRKHLYHRKCFEAMYQ